MKIQLTIKMDYLPDWNQWEGIRELVQNGIDAQVEHHAPFKVDWHNNTLRFENDGAVLPLKALLLGHTTKIGNSELRGKFGEGLKLGILALVRAGHPVRVRNGGEVWTPLIERSTTFDEDVLAFNIEKGRADKARVRIEVGNVTKSEWDLLRQNFLFIAKPNKSEVVHTPYGKLLKGARYQGKVFVKGIFVQNDPELQFGYDFDNAELDRDRKMVEGWNLRSNARNILMTAITKDKSLQKNALELLEQDTPETSGITEGWQVNGSAAEAAVKQFQKRHGEKAVPVASLAESQDVEHMGLQGVVVSKSLHTVLTTILESSSNLKEGLRKEVVRLWSWHELTPEEKRNLGDAIHLVNRVVEVSLSEIDVVDFRSEETLGIFEDGRTFIAHKHLEDPEVTLRILVHEVAHKMGHDGEKSHVQQIEIIWMGIVRHLRQKARENEGK